MKALGVALIMINIIWIFPIDIYLRWNHPELTETQLFLKYWHIWLAGLVSEFVGLYIVFKYK